MPVLLMFNFREFQIYQQYTRSYNNIFSVLTAMGGSWTSLSGIGLLITMFFSYNLMMASLIRKLYFFNAKYPGELTKEKKKTDPVETN